MQLGAESAILKIKISVFFCLTSLRTFFFYGREVRYGKDTVFSKERIHLERLIRHLLTSNLIFKKNKFFHFFIPIATQKARKPAFHF